MAKKWKDCPIEHTSNSFTGDGLNVRQYMLASVIRGMGSTFNILHKDVAKRVSDFVDYLEKVEGEK